MSKRVNLASLNGVLHEAFVSAQNSRRKVGLPPLPADELPRNYKTSMFWTPADIVDLLREMRRQGYSKGLVSFIQECVWLSVPKLAARPAPKVHKRAHAQNGKRMRSVAA